MATITQRASGRWQARIRRQGQPTMSKIFGQRSDAEAWAARLESGLERGIGLGMQVAEQISVAELLKEYGQSVPHKAGSHAYVIKRLAEDLGHYSLARLTPVVLTAWRDGRLQCVSSSTVNRELSTLGAALTWAIKDRGIGLPANPAHAVQRSPAGEARERRLDADEQQRLLDNLVPWLRPLVRLALETAMRQGELLALRWEHVDLKARVAHLMDTNGGQGRTVPLSSGAVAVLEALPRDDAERVFPRTAQAVQQAWNRACAQARLKDLHFRDLRHEATARLALKLPNVADLAAVTGHKELRMLERYYATQDRPMAEDLARKLSRFE